MKAEAAKRFLSHAMAAFVLALSATAAVPASPPESSSSPAARSLSPVGASVANEAVPLATDPALEARVMDLSHKLRCLVCQNQSIAESGAPLALDLRNEVREQLAAGKSEDAVVEYLVARYGDFVLYLPPFKGVTLLLWLGPALLLAAGAGWLGWRLHRRAEETRYARPLTPDERMRAEVLLSGTPHSPEEPRS